MAQHRWTAACVLSLTLALAACGGNTPRPSAEDSPSLSVASSSADIGPPADLSAIACATDDPNGVGELTGAWSGSKGGVYYIRQVGDCVWWFGTELDDIEPGLTGQPGFANVASGRLDGTHVVLEWADVPMGDILNGGGLTFVYDDENGTLSLIQQRGGGIPFGDAVLTRIEPSESPEPTPSGSPGP